MKKKKNTKNKTKVEKEIKITPLVKSLLGVIKLPQDYDYKKEYADYLIKKYS